MKNLVKLVAMTAFVFQAGAMETQKGKDVNLEYLRELHKTVTAILNDTTSDQIPEPTDEELRKIFKVDSILGKNSEDK